MTARKLIVRIVEYLTVVLFITLVASAVWGCLVRLQELRELETRCESK